jgi:hypothetical protein
MAWRFEWAPCQALLVEAGAAPIDLIATDQTRGLASF